MTLQEEERRKRHANVRDDLWFQMREAARLQQTERLLIYGVALTAECLAEKDRLG